MCFLLSVRLEHERIEKRWSHKKKAPEFPAAERGKIIDTLIHNSEIKEILIAPQRNNYITAEKDKDYNNELVVSPLTKR
jgi:hypothetical protein